MGTVLLEATYSITQQFFFILNPVVELSGENELLVMKPLYSTEKSAHATKIQVNMC